MSNTFGKAFSAKEPLRQSLLMVKWHPSWQPWISEGNDVELGKHIKEYRTARGMSQEDLAQRIYVTRQTVSGWGTEGV